MVSWRAFVMFAGLLVSAGLGVATADSAPDDADPFPIKRQAISEAELDVALKQLGNGPVVQLPQADFEARVRKAAQVQARAKVTPKFTRAEYTGRLTSDDDLSGTADWELWNPGEQAAPFALDPLRLAVKSASWSDGQAAILGNLGRGFAPVPTIWVPSRGRNALHLTWSATGSDAPGERRFEIRVPPCPDAIFDLTLPANRTPFPVGEILLAGPFHVADHPDLKRWRFRFGERNKLEFAVRGPGNASASETVLASLAARYEIVPGQVSCSFEYDLEPTRGDVAEWVFRVDPAARITDAVVFNRAGWFVDGPPHDRKLHVTLRHTGNVGKVLITAVAPPGSSSLPMIRPINAIIADERIELRIAPELKLRGWSTGDYRLTESSGNGEQSRTLSFVGSLSPSGAKRTFRRPPAVFVQSASAEYRTREGIAWRVENGHVVLMARLAIHVQRGPLFGLSVQTPAGFTRVRVNADQDNLIGFIRNTAVPHGIGIDFVRPLSAGQNAELVLEFRGPALSASGKPVRLPFPHLVPMGASEREGWLSLSAVPGWMLGADLTSGPLPVVDRAKVAFAPPADAVRSWAFRGREPEGMIVLTPVRPELAASVRVHLVEDDNAVMARTQLQLDVKSGAIQSLIVWEPGPPPANRSWIAPDVTNAVAATAIPAHAVLGLLPSLPSGLAVDPAFAPPLGTYWLLRFSRPVAAPITIESEAVALITPGVHSTISLPQLRVLDARRTEQTCELGSALERRYEVVIQSGWIELHPREVHPAPAIRHYTFTDLSLETTASSEILNVRFTGHVRGVPGTAFTLTLPTGAELQSSTVSGHVVGPGLSRGLRVCLPVIAAEAVPFMVHYRLPIHRSLWAASPPPELPDGPHEMTRIWRFEPDVLSLGGHSEDMVALVSLAHALALGFVLAGSVLAFAWLGGRRWPFATGCVLLPLTIALAYLLWARGAGWNRVVIPSLASSGAALILLILARSRSVRRRVPLAVAAILAASFTVMNTNAQPPALETVFVLASPTAPSVLASKSLLNRLEAAARRPEPTTVITEAHYRGRADETTARFTATFTVHAFRDGDTTLTLPLSDVRLEAATINGKPAFPTALTPDQYSFHLSGRGPHKIEVQYVVPIHTLGAEREIRFGTPEVPSADLQFATPGRPEQLLAVGRFGAQSRNTLADGVELRDDLGSGKFVHIRWRQGAPGNPAVTYREACIWTVSEAESELNACYLLRVDRGSVSRLRLSVPAELLVTRVSVRPGDTTAAASDLVRDWKLESEANGYRTLTISLLAPSDGRLVLNIECVPRHVLTRAPVLRFPHLNTSGAVPIPNGTFYAFRAGKLNVDDLPRKGVVDLTPDEMLFHFSGIADLKLDPRAPGLVFKPSGPKANPELRPLLQPGSERATTFADTTWRIGPMRSDAHGTLRWLGAPPSAAIEFDFPEIAFFGARLSSVLVHEIHGSDVAGWGQRGGRVQVWFRKPVKDPTLEWLGQLALAPAGRTDPIPFVAFTPRPANSRQHTNTLRLHPDTDSAVRLVRSKGWKSLAPHAGHEWAFSGDASAVPLHVQLFPPLPAPPPRGFGLLDRNHAELTFRGMVEIPLRAGRPQRVRLSVEHVPEHAVIELDLPPGIVVAEQTATARRQSWVLDVPSGGTSLRAAVQIRFPMRGDTMPMPVISTSTVERAAPAISVIHWLGLTGNAAGLILRGAAPAAIKDVQPIWPGEVDRVRRVGGTLWSVTASQGQATLVFTRP